MARIDENAGDEKEGIYEGLGHLIQTVADNADAAGALLNPSFLAEMAVVAGEQAGMAYWQLAAMIVNAAGDKGLLDVLAGSRRMNRIMAMKGAGKVVNALRGLAEVAGAVKDAPQARDLVVTKRGGILELLETSGEDQICDAYARWGELVSLVKTDSVMRAVWLRLDVWEGLLRRTSRPADTVGYVKALVSALWKNTAVAYAPQGTAALQTALRLIVEEKIYEGVDVGLVLRHLIWFVKGYRADLGRDFVAEAEQMLYRLAVAQDISGDAASLAQDKAVARAEKLNLKLTIDIIRGVSDREGEDAKLAYLDQVKDTMEAGLAANTARLWQRLHGEFPGLMAGLAFKTTALDGKDVYFWDSAMVQFIFAKLKGEVFYLQGQDIADLIDLSMKIDEGCARTWKNSMAGMRPM